MKETLRETARERTREREREGVVKTKDNFFRFYYTFTGREHQHRVEREKRGDLLSFEKHELPKISQMRRERERERAEVVVVVVE